MLYLKSIMLDKFKSFKHAELLMSKGFTCVVGPNGSGKSVIFDSLAVVLGEPSPSQLRVSALGQLINNTVKARGGEFAKAHIKLEFEGDEKVTVTKIIRSDSKTLYKLNGKTMSRREVIEFFSAKAIRVDDTTTIAQGEIDGISKLNSKQRRELIDVAAGIKEFEYKKNEALKNLEQVDHKISEANVSLKERQGYLTELEKDKEAAESFLEMSQRVKVLRYSVLIAKQSALKAEFEALTKDMSGLDSKKADLSTKKAEIVSKRDKLTVELQQLQGDLNKTTSTSGETRAKLENLSNELAKLDVEIPSLIKSLDEFNYFVEQSNAEVKEAKDRVKQNNSLITDLNKSITKLDAEIAKSGALPQGIDFDSEIEGLESVITNDENRLLDMQNYISKLQADSLITQSKKTETETLLAELNSKRAELQKAREDRAKLISDMKARAKKAESKIAELDEERANLDRSIRQSDEELQSLKEQKFMNSQSKDTLLTSKLSEKFKQSDGFYGKAANLCSYDSKYATAVETAASSRFEYFVVDSINTATMIIEYLKGNKLGRAAFIPIAEINSERQDGSSGKEPKPVIELVKFDSKFSKVFNYIFNNTYLINNPNDSKKYGVGRHRYVTLEGELIEPSGVISGGSQKGRMSLAAIENRLKAVTDENEKLKSTHHSVSASIETESREFMLLDMQLKALNTDSGESSNMLIDTERKISAATQSIAEFDKGIKKIGKEIEQKDSEKLEAISLLNKNKDRRKTLHDKFIEAAKGAANSKKLKEEKERLDTIRAESEANKIKRAELQKESQLLEDKCNSVSKATEEKQKQIKFSREQLKDKDARKEVLQKAKGEIEKELSGKNESAKKSISRINSTTEEINKLSLENGKYESEVGSLERQTNEIRFKRGTSETRLNDIAVDLKLFDPAPEPVKGKLDEMETEVNILNVKITALGNVNLRAPEIYEERKKSVEEAYSKVSTLQTEKQAVLNMIDEIDSKKLQTFMDMLNEVNKNFIKLYNYIYPGKGSIVLENEKDPLNSGLHIKIIEGKTEKQFMSMSGGERAIISLMLLFSIHMGKKSSLYIFDEVDAALDKENAKKLSLLIKEMSKEAQFIVISHNDSLIVNADAAIGVVKTEGESKAYGVDVASMIKK